MAVLRRRFCKAERLRYVHDVSCGSVFQTGLPYRAGIQGSKAPRLLRDRPTDGAAFCAKIYACRLRWKLWFCCVRMYARLSGYVMSMVGHTGQSFRLSCPIGLGSGGLKPPGY